MKNLFKKISALVLAAIMVLSMCTAVFAEGPSATIRVNNANGATLTYAKVIKADQTTRTGWNFVNKGVALAYIKAFSIAPITSVEDVTDVYAQQAIDSLIDLVDEDNPTVPVTSNELGKALAEAEDAVNPEPMSNPQGVNDAGVYLVKATQKGFTYNLMSAYVGFGKVEGTYPVLNSAVIEAKKSEIKLDKIVTDGDNVTHTGDVLTYEITTNVPAILKTENKTFTVKDTLEGAKFNKDLAVTMNGESVAVGNKIKYDDEAGKFELDLSSLLDDANSNVGKAIVIRYTVTVTSENDTITNTAKAKHGSSEEYGGTPVISYEGNITLTKYASDDDNNNLSDNEKLANAKFEVRKGVANENNEYTFTGDALMFTEIKDENDNVTAYKYDPNGTVSTIVTKADGTVKVQGLDIGKYQFKEIEAPKGYSVNQSPVEAELKLTTTNSKDGKAIAVLTDGKSMIDTKLNALPSTGGMGTYLFTIVGVVLMTCAAGAFFVSRRKTNK